LLLAPLADTRRPHVCTSACEASETFFNVIPKAFSEAIISALGMKSSKNRFTKIASGRAEHFMRDPVAADATAWAQDSQSFEVAVAPDFAFSMYLMFSDVRCRAALRPETRPNTTQSSKEFPPRRLLPCTPPIASPAA